MRYSLDGARLLRDVTFKSGPPSRQVVIAEGVSEFQVTQTQPRLYQVKVVLNGDTLNFKAYRLER